MKLHSFLFYEQLFAIFHTIIFGSCVIHGPYHAGSVNKIYGSLHYLIPNLIRCILRIKAIIYPPTSYSTVPWAEPLSSWLWINGHKTCNRLCLRNVCYCDSTYLPSNYIPCISSAIANNISSNLRRLHAKKQGRNVDRVAIVFNANIISFRFVEAAINLKLTGLIFMFIALLRCQRCDVISRFAGVHLFPC